jgi:hypothetical protein
VDISGVTALVRPQLAGLRPGATSCAPADEDPSAVDAALLHSDSL